MFSAWERDLGCTKLISLDIPLLDEAPVRQHLRRIPQSEYENLKAHINQLLEAKITCESYSQYASLIVLVKKKEGNIRMSVDYHQLNARTRKDEFPLPWIDDSLDSLSSAYCFTTLVLASGYNQVPVTEKDQFKKAFCTPFGLFEWNRMHFGLCNAPGSFQKLMEKLFGDKRLGCQSLLLYLDDVVVISTSVAQQLECLEVVLYWMQNEILKVS